MVSPTGGDIQQECLCAEKFSDTLETQRGITVRGVTAVGAANALRVLRAEEGRDKELIDLIFSGGFDYEIRDKASPNEFTATGLQLLCELIS